MEHQAHNLEFHLFAGPLVLLFGIISSKFSSKIGIPTLFVFFLLGIVLGPDALAILNVSPKIAQFTGIITLIMILFSGGIDTEWKSIRPIFFRGAVLATVGVVITGLITGYVAHFFLGLSLGEGLLIGAIISSTDASAVFTIMRGKNLGLKNQVKPFLEFESGSNDPMAVFLTVSSLMLLKQGEPDFLSIIVMFFKQTLIGLSTGVLFGRITPYFINKIKLDYDGLYPVISVSLILLVYGLTQFVGGNGFLSVYITAILMGRENFLHKKSLVLFHDGLAWLMQLFMFLLLGLIVSPLELTKVLVPGLIICFTLIFIARPASVFISLFRSSFSWREQGFISWVGLRGAVPIILATYPLIDGIAAAKTIFHVVFFVVCTSILIQGSTVSYMASFFKVKGHNKRSFRHPIHYVPSGDMKNDLYSLEIDENSTFIGKRVLELGLPKEALIVLIQRDNNVIIPRGTTTIQNDDDLLILTDPHILEDIKVMMKT